MRGRAVCISGMGAVTAAGTGVGALRALLTAGETRVHPDDALCGLSVGRAHGRVIADGARHLDRSGALFVTAAREAWANAAIEIDALDASRCAVIEGSSLGPMADLLNAHRARAGREHELPRPSGLVQFMAGAGGAAFAQASGVQGTVVHLSGGCVSSAYALIEGIEQIASDRADVVVAGGAECPLQRDIVDMFRAARLLADRNGAGCAPFDTHRCGTVLGEGAAALVLEAADHARRRGATPLAHVSGYGLHCEDFSMTAPDPDGGGVAAAVRRALSGVPAESVGWIKTHGAGTRLNDAAETRGLATVFGRRLPDIALTSLKPMIGHCIGASGVVESVAALLALADGFVPPTLGTREVDGTLPPCTVVTRREDRTAGTILLLTASFGGRYAAIAISRRGEAARHGRPRREEIA